MPQAIMPNAPQVSLFWADFPRFGSNFGILGRSSAFWGDFFASSEGLTQSY